MADNLQHVGSPDNDLISLSERWEVLYWTKVLGCTEQQLKNAISKVGHSAKKVREYLKNN